MRKRKTHAISEFRDAEVWYSLCGKRFYVCIDEIDVKRPTCGHCKRALAARKGNK